MGDLLAVSIPIDFYIPVRICPSRRPHSLWEPHRCFWPNRFPGGQAGLYLVRRNALFFALPANVAWPLTFILRPILAGLFMAFFFAVLGRSPRCRVGCRDHLLPSQASWCPGKGGLIRDSALWLPLIFPVHQPHATVSSAALCRGWQPLAFAMPFLAGHPEVAFHPCSGGDLFRRIPIFWPPIASTGCPDPRMHFFWRFRSGRYPRHRTGLDPAFFPTFEWLHYTRRSLTNSMGNLVFAVAGHGCDLLARSDQDAQFGRSELPGRGVLCGACFTLAGSGLPASSSAAKRDVIFFGGLLATAMQIIYGWGPAYFFSKVIPVLSGNAQLAPHLGLLISVLPTLAGLGLSALEGWGADRPVSSPKLPWIILLGVSLIGNPGIGALHLRETAGACPWYRNHGFFVGAARDWAVILAVFLQRRMSVRAFSSTALVLVAVESVVLQLSPHALLSPRANCTRDPSL